MVGGSNCASYLASYNATWQLASGDDVGRVSIVAVEDIRTAPTTHIALLSRTLVQPGTLSR